MIDITVKAKQFYCQPVKQACTLLLLATTAWGGLSPLSAERVLALHSALPYSKPQASAKYCIIDN